MWSPLTSLWHFTFCLSFFFLFSFSLFFSLDTFSPHFPLKKHLNIWVVLGGPQKNKSGNKDTKWAKKMAKKWALQPDHVWRSKVSEQPKCVFQITLWTKSVSVRFCGFKYPKLVSIVLIPKSEPGLHSVCHTRHGPLSVQMLKKMRFPLYRKGDERIFCLTIKHRLSL